MNQYSFPGLLQFFDIKQLQVWFPMYDHYYTSVNYSIHSISISHPFPHYLYDFLDLVPNFGTLTVLQKFLYRSFFFNISYN